MSGIMDIIQVPLGYLMSFLYSLFGNYLVALLVFAVIIKLILFPLSIKQQKNSQKQARLRPKENAIRKKYAGRTDKATQTKMQEEILALYQSEGFNPASGCLPMLIQLPILFAVFSVVTRPLTYILRISKENIEALKEIVKPLIGNTEALEVNWIKAIVNDKTIIDSVNSIKPDLYAEIEKFHDNFDFFGILNLLDKPEFKLNWLITIPILTFVIVYFSMKLTRKFTYQPSQGNAQQDNATAASMKIMDLMMPFMSVFFSFMYPAAIGIYWMMQNLLGSVQQYALYKIFPIPTFTEEELKQAELALKGKSDKPKKQKAEKNDDEKPAKKAPLKKGEHRNRKATIKESTLRKVRENKVIPMAKKKI